MRNSGIVEWGGKYRRFFPGQKAQRELQELMIWREMKEGKIFIFRD